MFLLPTLSFLVNFLLPQTNNQMLLFGNIVLLFPARKSLNEIAILPPQKIFRRSHHGHGYSGKALFVPLSQNILTVSSPGRSMTRPRTSITRPHAADVTVSNNFSIAYHELQFSLNGRNALKPPQLVPRTKAILTRCRKWCRLLRDMHMRQLWQPFCWCC